MTEDKKIKCPNCKGELDFDMYRIKNRVKIFCTHCKELINFSLVNEDNIPILSIEDEVNKKIKSAFDKAFKKNKNIKVKWKI